MFCRPVIPWKHTHFQSHILRGVGKFMISLRIINWDHCPPQKHTIYLLSKTRKNLNHCLKRQGWRKSESFHREFCFSEHTETQMEHRGKLSHENPDLGTSEMWDDTPGRISGEPTVMSMLRGQNTPHATGSVWDTKRSIVSFEWQVTRVSNVSMGHLIPPIWLTDWLSDCVWLAETFPMCEMARCLF